MARILVIDDSPSVLQLVGQILLDAGHEVVLAANGHEGLSLLESRSIHLLITDIYMPGQDGIQTIRNCRRLYPKLPILAMSSKSGNWDMLRIAKAMGAGATISKPFQATQLLPVVAGILAGEGIAK